MAFIAPAAKAVAKHEIKKHVEDGVKHKAEATIKTKAKEHVAKKKSDASKFIKDTGAKGKAKAGKVAKAHKPHFFKSPPSYNVRKYHNLLISMWLISTILMISDYFSDGKQGSVAFWKRWWALQVVFFILSLLVMIQSMTKVVSYLSVLITITVAFINRAGLTGGVMTALTNGLKAPQPAAIPVHYGSELPSSDVTPTVPRNTDTIST